MEEIKIKYDPTLYQRLIETARLVKIDESFIDYLSDSDLEKKANKQIGEELVFTSDWIFTTRDLSRILKVHMPIEANAFHDKCKDNILRVRFYKIYFSQPSL